MLSKLIKTMLKYALMVSTLVMPLMAAAFSEGTDYQVLEKPIPHADKTLIKVFSYDCPFCYKYDKAVTAQVMEKVADIVAFTPFHLETKGTYGKQASEVFAVKRSLLTMARITIKKSVGLMVKTRMPLSRRALTRRA